MKKIVIALVVLFFLTGCQSSSPDSKSTNQTTQEQKQEAQENTQGKTQEEAPENTQQETTNDTASKQPETKETTKPNTETKQTTNNSQSNTSQNTPPPVIEETTPTPPVETKKYVTVSIDCKTILNNMDSFKEQYKSFVPSNGIILADTKVEYTNRDTALSLLKKVTKEKGIRIIDQGGYISNIANLNQMGMKSGQGGWMYKVNGTLGDVGAGSYKLSSGDVVQWRYTCLPGDI